MMILDIAPNLLATEQAPPWPMKSETLPDGSTKTTLSEPNGQVLAVATQQQSPHSLVRFFQGKGGFCVVVNTADAIYFGLPGCRITLPDTHVELPGEPISGKPVVCLSQPTQTPIQTITRQAMILGAGLATRFEPISGETTGRSKPAIPLVGDDAVITAIAKHLRHHGFSRILVNTYYMPASLKRQLDHLDGIEIDYIDEPAPSGTAGGLLSALQHNRVNPDEPMLIIQGDAVTDCDLSFLMNTHQQRQAAVSIGGQIVPDRDVSKYGIVETDSAGGDGQSGWITRFIEKPTLAEAGNSRFANAGFYVLAPEVFDLFIETGQRQFTQAPLYDYAQHFFPAVLQAVSTGSLHNAQGQSMGFWAQALSGYWSDIGNPTQYVEALRDIYGQCIQIEHPDRITDYYEHGIIYWPGCKVLAQRDKAELSGNVIVAKSLS